MRLTTFAFTLLFSSALFGQAPSGYYSSATGSGYALKSQLHDIIDNHNQRTYGDVWDFIIDYDEDSYYENNNSVLDIYSENPSGTDPYNYTKGTNQCGNYSGEGSCYNREHSFPKSWFSDGYPMYSDIHHLFPTDGYVNGQRSNLPYGEVGSASFTSDNGSKKGSARSDLGYSGTVFEPIDEFKGDLARAYFYMATRYEDVLTSWSSSMLDGSSTQVYEDWALDMLLQWHIDDPVSQKEIDRNNNAQTFQGNRNPFVDHPEWVAAIWGGSTTPSASITLSQSTTLAFGSVETGQSSASQSYTVSGSNLNTGVTVAVSSPFEVSLNNTTWAQSVVVSESNAESGSGNAVFLRFSPTSAGSYNESISHAATGATTINLSATGTATSTGGGGGGAANSSYAQSFEGVSADTWTYTANPQLGTFTGSDVWDIVSSLTGVSNMPTAGSLFLGGSDINNSLNPNTTFTEITFASVDVTGLEEVTIQFDYQVDGFDVDNGDNITYEIYVNGTLNKSVTLFTSGTATETSSISESISNGSSTVGLKLIITQNGSDYFGFDNFLVLGSAPQNEWTGAVSSDWANAGNWSGSEVPAASDDALVTNQGTSPVINSSHELMNLEIQSGAELTINSGAALLVGGSVTGSGSATVKRNSTGSGGYSIVGSAVSNASIENLAADYAQAFDAGYTAATGLMTPGKGYFIGYENANPEVSVSGQLNSGTITYPVSAGFQLVANPYAAAISQENFQNENANMTDGTLYFWDDGGVNIGGNRAGSYVTVNDLGVISTESFGGSGQGTGPAEAGVIPSSQGFFVNATGSGAISFTSDMQTIESGVNDDENFYRKDQAPSSTLQLSVTSGGITSRTMLGFIEGATTAKDFGLDALKLTSDSTPISIYSMLASQKMAIQGLPLAAEETVVVPLGIKVSESGDYTLAVDLFEGLSTISVRLQDNLTGNSYDLDENFELTTNLPAREITDRFSIAYSLSSPLSIADLAGFELQVSSTAIAVSGFGNQSNERIEIFSLEGKQLFSEQISFSGGAAKIAFQSEPNRIYILQVGNLQRKFLLAH